MLKSALDEYTVFSFLSPALSSDAFTFRSCAGFDAVWRAVAALAAQQRVVVESLILTHITGWFDCLRRADTASRHLVAQSATTLTRCGKEKDILLGSIHVQISN